jgi:hypothetical protein
VRQLREAFILHPSLFSKELFDATFIKDHRIQDNWPEIVEMLKAKSASYREAIEKPAKKVIVRIDLNVDGVQIVKHTARAPQMTPILGRISALEDERTRFVFSREMPVFMVGFYHGTSKAPVSEITRELVMELKVNSPVNIGFEHQQQVPPKRVSPAIRRKRRRKRTLVRKRLAGKSNDLSSSDDDSDEEMPLQVDEACDADQEDAADCAEEAHPVEQEVEASIDASSIETFIRVERIVLDAPALSNFAGTTHHSGYNSLPKCTLRGMKKPLIEGSGGRVLKWSSTHFSSTNCRLRKDDDWEEYRTGEVSSWFRWIQ